jgi:type VI secretion system protein ImpA
MTLNAQSPTLPWIPGYTLPTALTQTLTAVCAPLPDTTIAAQGPSGASLRYTPVFQAIRSAREEDDPTLPRGEWTRTLKRADWHQVIQTCEAALKTESKDFQLAAWLAEAWTRLYGADGVCAGLMLFEWMIEHDWAQAHPSIDDGDADARIGVFMWLRDALSAALTRHLPLLQREEGVVTLDDWQRLLITVPANAGNSDSHGEASPPTRDSLIEFAQGPALMRLEQLRVACVVALALLPGMTSKMDAAAGHDAPSFERVAQALTGLQRAAISLVNGRIPEHDPFKPLEPLLLANQNSDLDDLNRVAPMDALHALEHTIDGPTSVGVARSDTGDWNDGTYVGIAEEVSHLASTSSPTGDPVQTVSVAMTPTSVVLDTPSGSVVVHNREHAYQLLEALAGYLTEQEPHSPTPYLLMRGVSWGQMSLLELMQDISQDEADLRRYFGAIGVKL